MDRRITLVCVCVCVCVCCCNGLVQFSWYPERSSKKGVAYSLREWGENTRWIPKLLPSSDASFDELVVSSFRDSGLSFIDRATSGNKKIPKSQPNHKVARNMANTAKAGVVRRVLVSPHNCRFHQHGKWMQIEQSKIDSNGHNFKLDSKGIPNLCTILAYKIIESNLEICISYYKIYKGIQGLSANY